LSNTTPAILASDKEEVGKLYHLMLEGTLQVDSTLRRYGYMLVPSTGEGGGLQEAVDIADKSALTQFGSPNVSDRDLVRIPRVTQGDFTGGQGQATFIDPQRYWDSDMDIDHAGNLRLRPAWKRKLMGTPTGGGGDPKVVGVGSSIFATIQTCSQVWIVDSAGTISDTSFPGATVKDLATDGEYCYALTGDGTKVYRAGHTTPSTWVLVANVSSANLIWIVKLSSTPGLSGFYLLYLDGSQSLWRVDIADSSTFPIASGTRTAIPINGNDVVLDLARYQSGIAILAKDGGVGGSGTGSNWTTTIHYYDGVSLTRLVTIDGYGSTGFVAMLGDLFVSLNSPTYLGPILARISPAGYEIVADPNVPGFQASSTAALKPQASAGRVYWPLNTVQSAISGSGNWIAVFDSSTAVLSHFSPMDATDTAPGGHAGFFASGKSLFMAEQPGGAGTTVNLQVTRDNVISDAGIRYSSTGKMITSQYDFGTPNIPKQFKRVDHEFAPLPVNCSVKVDVFADLDPINWTSSLTPTATVTVTTAAATKASVNLPTATMAKSIYVVLTYASSDNLATPSGKRLTIYANSLWIITARLDCTGRPSVLTGREDPSGLRGTDRYFFLHRAWEDSISMTLYLPNGVVYAVEIEDAKFWTKSPMNRSTEISRSDYEAYADMTFRVTAVS
jgi:hypothetical protein